MHETVKQLLALGRPLDSPEFLPVHAVLNGLPGGWEAQVVAALSPEFGLIEVRAGEDRVQVVFHLEDVWDTAGQPALLSPGLSMQALQGRPVDLTARSVCRESEPNKILGLQDCLQQIPRPSQMRVGPGQLGAQDSPAHFYLNPLLG